MLRLRDSASRDTAAVTPVAPRCCRRISMRHATRRADYARDVHVADDTCRVLMLRHARC